MPLPSMTAGSSSVALSQFTDDIGLRREPRGSALPKFPSSVSDGGWFRGYTGLLLRCGLSSCSPPLYGSDQEFPPANGTFTPELPASRSPFSSSGITTVATVHFHRWDFHPLESQLASLHGLRHPRTGAFRLLRSPRFDLQVVAFTTPFLTRLSFSRRASVTAVVMLSPVRAVSSRTSRSVSLFLIFSLIATL
jgi:hypothetical protein